MLYMLDTDTSSYVIKKRPTEALELMELTSQNNDICISVVTYAELLLGAERSDSKRKHYKLINEFCERLDAISPWDESAAEHFAKLQAHLYSKGTPIGGNDTMISAHALSLQATIVTNNQKHFSKVPKLKLANWVA